MKAKIVCSHCGAEVRAPAGPEAVPCTRCFQTWHVAEYQPAWLGNVLGSRWGLFIFTAIACLVIAVLLIW